MVSSTYVSPKKTRTRTRITKMMRKVPLPAYYCIFVFLILKVLFDTTINHQNPYEISTFWKKMDEAIFSAPSKNNNMLGGHTTTTVKKINPNREVDAELLRHRQTFAIHFIAVISMQRTSSTSFVFNVLNETSPCVVPMDEIFNIGPKPYDGPKRWPQKWELFNRPIDYDANQTYSRGVTYPDDLVTFVRLSAQQACEWRQEFLRRAGHDMTQLCSGNCIVSFKEFPEHLWRYQHAYVWNHLPNLTFTVLERNVEDRWKSIWLAAQEGDWDTTGSQQHKAKLRNSSVSIPLANNSGILCHTPAFINTPGLSSKDICNFTETHQNWYNFVRRENPERIEIRFDDVAEWHGYDAVRQLRIIFKRRYQIDDTNMKWYADGNFSIVDKWENRPPPPYTPRFPKPPPSNDTNTTTYYNNTNMTNITIIPTTTTIPTSLEQTPTITSNKEKEEETFTPNLNNNHDETVSLKVQKSTRGGDKSKDFDSKNNNKKEKKKKKKKTHNY